MVDSAQLLTLLRSFPFLADQPQELLEDLAQQARLLRLSLGQPICRAGAPPSDIHFLLQGSVRSVVMANRLPKGVATLQRLQPGAVVGWSALSSGRNHEILIASTELVTLALPPQALVAAMERNPQLATRVRGSVNPAELFAVLDQHLLQHPRALSHEVVEAARSLADSTQVLMGATAELMARPLPSERLWLSAGEGLPLGAMLPPLPDPDAVPTLRLLGIDRQALAACLDPRPVQEQAVSQPGWSELLQERWEDQRRSLEQEIEVGADPLPAELEEEPDPDRQPPRAFPWYRGVGPLESPIAAFRMLSDHLGLPYRRELLRRVFGDQVKRHGEASLALAGAVAESIGLHTQLLQIEVTALRRLEAPLMVRWGNGLALIYRIHSGSLVLGIPSVSNQELSYEQFREQWGE